MNPPHPIFLIGRWILKLPPGIVEDCYEFLIAIALGTAGLVEFMIPSLFTPVLLQHEVPFLPVLAILIWGCFFFFGGIMTAIGVGLRHIVWLKRFPHVIEACGLSLLGSATGAYAMLAIIFSVHTAGSIISGLILLAIALGFLMRVFILSPGVYERVVRREFEREVNRIIKRG